MQSPVRGRSVGASSGHRSVAHSRSGQSVSAASIRASAPSKLPAMLRTNGFVTVSVAASTVGARSYVEKRHGLRYFAGHDREGPGGSGASVATCPVQDHALALLAFERENREYFAASVSDRGDEYFAEFATRHGQVLQSHADGTDYFHVLVADDGAILGRVNLYRVAAGSAELGYRIAPRAAGGRGLATAAVRQVCTMAVTDYELHELTAKTTLDNVGSRTVLGRTGFVVTGLAALPGGPGLSYRLALV